MTLFKQIIIILSFFQTIILGVVMWQNFHTVNEFLQTQLKFDATHTANSLGLSITPAAGENDLTTIQTMINSMFDSGYYEMIRLDDADNKVVIKNYQPTVVADVPNWFIKLIKIEAPIGSSEIMAGWVPFGTLHVQNSTGLAYRQLWNTFKDISISFILISLIAFFILNISLKIILEPLKEVQKQAEAITGNDFIFQDKMPRTVELNQVVKAMNTMIFKVKDIFDQEANTVQKYHNLLYKDEDTDLYNRRYFKLKFEEYLETEEEFTGSIIFANFNNDEKLKSHLGFQKTKQLLNEIGSIMKQASNVSDFSIVSYFDSWDFAFLLPTLNQERSEELFMSMSQEIQNLIASYNLDNNEYFFYFGGTKYQAHSKTSEIFAQADFALSTAKASQKNYTIFWNEDENREVVLGKEAWRKEILDAMETNRLLFAIQRVINNKDEIYHNEVFIRFKGKDDAIYNAGYFMPMVRELKLINEIDKYVLHSAITMLDNHELPPTQLSINISRNTIFNIANLPWLEELLKELHKHSDYRVNFEISSRGALDIKTLAKTSKELRDLGFTIGLDNFTLDGNSLKFLQEANPDYIKIQASSILDLFEGEAAVSSKKALDIIIKTMDIKMIAVGIETKEDKIKLQELGISYFQGSFIEEPYLV